jgi:hypothetical protein
MKRLSDVFIPRECGYKSVGAKEREWIKFLFLSTTSTHTINMHKVMSVYFCHEINERKKKKKLTSI